MKGLKCRYTEEMCPYIPVALRIQCDECMVKKAYKRGFYEERPQGKWIDVNGDGSIMKCSQCGEEVCCKDNNFCPNCGAVMRKERG